MTSYSRSATHSPHAPQAPIHTLPYECYMRLCGVGSPLRFRFGAARDVFEATFAIRHGVQHGPRSAFHIRGFGPSRYAEMLAWLSACGYATDKLQLPAKFKTAPRRQKRTS